MRAAPCTAADEPVLQHARRRGEKLTTHVASTSSEVASEVAARRPRFLFLTTDFKPQTGGIAEYLHMLAEHLSEHASVTVMSSLSAGEATWGRHYDFQQLPPLPQRRLGMRVGDGFAPLRKLRTLLYLQKLRRYARALAPRVTAGDFTAVYLGLWTIETHFWCEALRQAGTEYNLI